MQIVRSSSVKGVRARLFELNPILISSSMKYALVLDCRRCLTVLTTNTINTEQIIFFPKLTLRDSLWLRGDLDWKVMIRSR